MEDRSDTKRSLVFAAPDILGGFLRWPVRAHVLLARNFSGLSRQAEARRYLMVGLPVSLAALILLVILPGKLSAGLFIGCAFAGKQMARDLHFGGAKAVPEGSRIQSNWRTFCSTVASFVIWMVLVLVTIMALGAAGYNVPGRQHPGLRGRFCSGAMPAWSDLHGQRFSTLTGE